MLHVRQQCERALQGLAVHDCTLFTPGSDYGCNRPYIWLDPGARPYFFIFKHNAIIQYIYTDILDPIKKLLWHV